MRHISHPWKLHLYGTFLLADFLDLTLDDVGTCIELVYTPMRKDGMRGNPKKIQSDVVAPG